MMLLQTQEEWVLDLTCGAGGLPAKVDVAALTNAVVRAIFLILLWLIWQNVHASWDIFLRKPNSSSVCKVNVS